MAAAIIIPCYNRKLTTLACLGMLRPLMDNGWNVILVDDGSTDGTSEEVRRSFSSVTILHGAGSLFWTGAVELGMRHAIAQGANCCVWLNDDVTIKPQAIIDVSSISIAKDAMVSGQGKIRLENGTDWWFPIMKWTKKGLDISTPDHDINEPYAVDCCRGNLVAIPKCIIDAIGYPDGKNVPHAGGDTDYSLRATRAGFPCLIAPNAIFWEEENIRTDNRSWLLDDRSPLKILRSSLSRRGSVYPRMLFIYKTRHWGLRGLFRASYELIKLFTAALLKIILPKKIRLHLFANKSHAYQSYLIRGIKS